MKKLIYLLLGVMIISNIISTKAFASEIKTVDPDIQDLINLNDPGWNEFLSELDLDSENIEHKEFFLKIYEDENMAKADEKVYTLEEYLMENRIRGDIDIPGVNWLKVSLTAYPNPVDYDKVSIVGGFRWLSTPQFQHEDIFTVSSDSNFIIPGINERVNVAYWPNMSAPTIVGIYGSSSSNLEFDNYGISAKLRLSGTEFNSQIYNLTNAKDYFQLDGNGAFRTLGNPKGTIGFVLKRSNSTTINGKIGLTYFHKQMSINVSPSVGVDSSGNVSLGGIGWETGFDKATTSISYEWRDSIE